MLKILPSLNRYRRSIDNGEELSSQQFARYQALEAQDARLAQSKFSFLTLISSLYNLLIM